MLCEALVSKQQSFKAVKILTVFQNLKYFEYFRTQFSCGLFVVFIRKFSIKC